MVVALTLPDLNRVVHEGRNGILAADLHSWGQKASCEDRWVGVFGHGRGVGVVGND